MTMQKLFSKISSLFLLGFFLFPYYVYGQSCSSLKDIFENYAHCNKKEVFIHGKVLDNSADFTGPNYASEFNLTDAGNVIKVLSKDFVFLVKGDEVTISGKYYQNSEGDSSDDRIAALSSKNITVMLTAEEYSDLLVNYVGRNIIKNENLRFEIVTLYVLVPLFSVGTFGLGYYIFYRRRQKRGIEFESYVENSFSRDAWEIEQKNTFRKLDRWVRSFANPDFVFVHRKTAKRLAVECKYRFSLPRDGGRIFWANEYQIKSYQDFSQKEKIPVFVILGIAGSPKHPKRIFLIPLGQIKYPDVKIDYLEKFERDPKKLFSLDGGNNLI